MKAHDGSGGRHLRRGAGALLVMAVALVSHRVGPAAPPPPKPAPQKTYTQQQVQQLLNQQQMLFWGQQQAQAQALQQALTARVLFVGDSYSGSNRMPDMLAALARAGNVAPLVYDGQLAVGASLAQHLQQGAAVQKIRLGNWKVIVLQDQGLMPVLRPQLTLQAALQFNQEIARVGARPLYFQTWAPKDTPQAQGAINQVYQACAQQGQNAGVAPVGRAFQLAQAADPKLALYQADKSHPTPAGSYLAACVLYTTLYGQSPIGLPGQLHQQGQLLVNLPPATAQLLQQAALDAILGK
jgi:hypothetical protein